MFRSTLATTLLESKFPERFTTVKDDSLLLDLILIGMVVVVVSQHRTRSLAMPQN